MGRKKVIPSMKKEQVSVSLPRHIVERLDLLTSRRSQWILKAIVARLDGEEDVDIRDFEVRDILEDLNYRFHVGSTMEIMTKQLLEVYENLPESGE